MPLIKNFVKKLESCRICGNTELVPVLSLGDQALTGVFPRSKTQPVTSGPLELVKCHGKGMCSLLQLAHSYDSSEMYGLNYGYRSGLNQDMVSHLTQKVSSLMENYPVTSGDVVLDIGSNDGTLLSCYPDGPLLIGMDPTAAKFRSFYQSRISVVPDFFSAKNFLSASGGKKARIVTSIAMLYDLDEPVEFVRQIASILRKDGVWHFEQSYMPLMVQSNAYDTICHEHLEYYGLRQIQWILRQCGMKVLDVAFNDTNGGSFAVTAALESALYPAATSRIAEILNSEAAFEQLAPYEEFKSCVSHHRDALCERLVTLSREGARVLGYGASTKGNVILQYCGLTEREIPAIAEVNPDKFGAFTPGSLIPILSEQEAHALKPDYFLVLPWHFREGLIRRENAFLKRGGRMLFPLPSIDVVGV
jgi:hypothetical protein